jgi:phage-related protein
MKAVNDYRILMPNIPYYETGLRFNQFDVVYYTGIKPGSYTGPAGIPVENISASFATGYYYATGRLNSGDNLFYMRPDSYVSGPNNSRGSALWTQNYFFVPTYGSTINFKSSYFQNNFQDSYQVIVGKSENVLHCEASLQFKGISDNEAKCLNHFYQNSFVAGPLADGQGHKTINMYLFPPHTKTRPFYLKSIDNNFENINSNDVTLNVESPFISSTSWKEKLIPYSSAQNYSSSKTYSKHDYILVKDLSLNNGFYYFSGDNSQSNIYPPTAPWTNKFYFSPDLVQQLSFDSTIYKNELAGFYLYQDLGLNPNFLSFNLSFNNRSDKEAKAILHFLENHNGIDLFAYDMYAYFTGTRNFFCPEWSHTYNFLDNNTISAKFIEFKFASDRQLQFNSELKPIGHDFGFLPQGFTKEYQYQIGNNTRRYAVLYTIGNKIEQPSYSSNFFDYDQDNGKFLTVDAGRTGFFNIIYSIPQNVDSSANQDLRGSFTITQESENLGILGSNLSIDYTGIRRNAGAAAPYNFLSGVQNCVASPVYDQTSKSLGLKVRWTLPGSGYYFTSFVGKIATDSSFTTNLTTKTLSIPLNTNNYLYDIGTPNEKLYSLIFNGLSFNTPYYISIEGANSTYTSHTSQYVYASGVADCNAWLNPSVEYAAVNSGLTPAVLSILGISAPSITISKEIKPLRLTNSAFEYFDLYDYISRNFPYGPNLSYYSGITIDFVNTKIGPQGPNSSYGIYDSGSFLITGNYSAMPSGVTLNFYNNSFVYGKGGSVTKKNNDTIKQGKNAFYIKCSGLININIDSTSVIAGGGGAGENIELTDLVSVVNSKYDKLKEEYNYTNVYNGKSYPDYDVTFDRKASDDTIKDFNNPKSLVGGDILNKNYCTTNGAGILYDFFNPNLNNPALVYGGAGAPYGKGSGTLFSNGQRIQVQNADLINPSQSYVLKQIVTLQADIFKRQI